MAKEILKITGTLIEIGETQSGVSQKSGKDWTRQEFIIKTEGKYAKPACFSVFNSDDIGDKHKLKDFIEVCFNLESRKYNEKWYTNAQAWETRTLSGSKEDVNFEQDKQDVMTGQPPAGEENNDLPF